MSNNSYMVLVRTLWHHINLYNSMHSCTPSKSCMAMIWFYILLIDYGRQVYCWKIAENILQCRVKLETFPVWLATNTLTVKLKGSVCTFNWWSDLWFIKYSIHWETSHIYLFMFLCFSLRAFSCSLSFMKKKQYKNKRFRWCQNKWSGILIANTYPSPSPYPNYLK